MSHAHTQEIESVLSIEAMTTVPTITHDLKQTAAEEQRFAFLFPEGQGVEVNGRQLPLGGLESAIVREVVQAPAAVHYRELVMNDKLKQHAEPGNFTRQLNVALFAVQNCFDELELPWRDELQTDRKRMVRRLHFAGEIANPEPSREDVQLAEVHDISPKPIPEATQPAKPQRMPHTQRRMNAKPEKLAAEVSPVDVFFPGLKLHPFEEKVLKAMLGQGEEPYTFTDVIRACQPKDPTQTKKLYLALQRVVSVIADSPYSHKLVMSSTDSTNKYTWVKPFERDSASLDAILLDQQSEPSWPKLRPGGMVETREIDDNPEEEWKLRGLCRQVNPEMFYPGKGEAAMAREAKKVCLACDVRDICLETSLENSERFGVWGGLSERERRKVLRRA